jgi:D-ornithine 4,5-aminomutase subunit alpha
MKKNMTRSDDFAVRRQKLAGMSSEELKQHFWALAEKIVDPLLDSAKKYTSPSIERSIVLRMGFSSLEASPLINRAIDHGLMGKGVGHLIYRVANDKKISVRNAGLEMIDGLHWDYLEETFKQGAC